MIPLSFLPSFVYDKSMSERTQIGRGGGGGGKGRYSRRQGGGKGRKAILHSARKKRTREKEEAGKGGAEEKEEGGVSVPPFLVLLRSDRAPGLRPTASMPFSSS